VALRKTVEAAYARIGEENAKGPGYIPDEETINALAAFKGELRHRFGIRGLTIPPSLTPTAWLDVLDPAVNVEEIPAKIRRAILPRLFYTPGVWEVVWTSPDFVDNRQVWFDAALSKSWGLTFPMWL